MFSFKLFHFGAAFAYHFITGNEISFLRVFTLEFVVWSISCNYLHEMPRNKIHCGCCFIAVILTEMKVLSVNTLPPEKNFHFC